METIPTPVWVAFGSGNPHFRLNPAVTFHHTSSIKRASSINRASSITRASSMNWFPPLIAWIQTSSHVNASRVLMQGQIWVWRRFTQVIWAFEALEFAIWELGFSIWGWFMLMEARTNLKGFEKYLMTVRDTQACQRGKKIRKENKKSKYALPLEGRTEEEKR